MTAVGGPGMPANARELGEQAFPYANHPRERVSWYQAVAFCRWLTARLHAGTLPVDGISGDARQYVITLPHEYEWEAAARYPDGRFYPWGADFDPEKANTDEGKIGGTTAVGIYPAGRQPQLDLYDLSGNVWEWCRNKYGKPDDDRVDAGGDGRALRGGSWQLDRTTRARPTASLPIQTTATTMSVSGWSWRVVPHLNMVTDLCSPAGER
jgi:formylglycine-generating enzyme required for sulfatase activity